jgi:hypothetical protein
MRCLRQLAGSTLTPTRSPTRRPTALTTLRQERIGDSDGNVEGGDPASANGQPPRIQTRLFWTWYRMECVCGGGGLAAASESAWQRRRAGAGPPNGQEEGIGPAKGGGREGTRFERGATAARIVVGRWQVPASAVTSALVARLPCSSTCNACERVSARMKGMGWGDGDGSKGDESEIHYLPGCCQGTGSSSYGSTYHCSSCGSADQVGEHWKV